MKTLHQKYTVITFDEAIYCKAKEIQWRCADVFSDIVLRLGVFHTVLNFMAVIGKRYEESGLEDLLIESGVYGSNIVMRVMRGKVYNKGIRAMKLTMEALSRLRLSALADYLGSEVELDEYIENVDHLKESFVQNDIEKCTHLLKNIAKGSDNVFSTS